MKSGEGNEGRKQCGPAFEDYYECLHHTKEVGHSFIHSMKLAARFLTQDFPFLRQAARAMEMSKAMKKAQAATPRDNAPKAEEVRGLGLLSGKKE